MLQRSYRPLIPLLLASLLGCAEEAAPLDQQLYVWQRQWRPAHAEALAALSPRELDILGLAAQGLDNDAIAAKLVLSVRTVERHLQNVYAKLGLQGRTARAAAVGKLLSRG